MKNIISFFMRFYAHYRTARNVVVVRKKLTTISEFVMKDEACWYINTDPNGKKFPAGELVVWVNKICGGIWLHEGQGPGRLDDKKISSKEGASFKLVKKSEDECEVILVMTPFLANYFKCEIEHYIGTTNNSAQAEDWISKVNHRIANPIES